MVKCYYCDKKDIDPAHYQLRHNFTMNPRGIVDTVVSVQFNGFICQRCRDIWRAALNDLRIPSIDDFEAETTPTPPNVPPA